MWERNRCDWVHLWQRNRERETERAPSVDTCPSSRLPSLFPSELPTRSVVAQVRVSACFSRIRERVCVYRLFLFFSLFSLLFFFKISLWRISQWVWLIWAPPRRHTTHPPAPAPTPTHPTPTIPPLFHENLKKKKSKEELPLNNECGCKRHSSSGILVLSWE